MEFSPSVLNNIRNILHPIHYSPYAQLMKCILRASIDNFSFICFMEGELSVAEQNWLVQQGFQVKHVENRKIIVMW